MPRITLPDGSVRSFDQPVSAYEIAADIGAGLARAAIGARVDGVLCDISTMIISDAEVSLVTPMDRKTGESDEDALFLIRHSAAHVMAEAIQRVVPGVQLVYGPPVENGFYYDMAVPDDRPLSSEDFVKIEAEMAAIIAEDRPFTRYELPMHDGLEKLRVEGSKYKIDNAERAIDAGADTLSWYATGVPSEDWEDLCRGPHVPSTGRIGAFKVMSLASAYWHGDADSDHLTRVYGTAFADRQQLDRYLYQLEEAKARDHRVLGKQLRLFHFDDAVGTGLALWTPNGACVRHELQVFISEELRKQGYHQVFTPHIGKLDLYRTSGHFPYYQDSQFPPIIQHDELASMVSEGCSCGDLANRMRSGDIDGFLLKPMNCPHHCEIYQSKPHSYRDLPLRIAEFGTVYRYEQSGELHGLTRVRGFTQDDAHIFCRPDQVKEEFMKVIDIVLYIFRILKFDRYKAQISLRDPENPTKYFGKDAQWNSAEQAIVEAAAEKGLETVTVLGEAAFYGPKLDFMVKDALGREWQLGTIQVDYQLPDRFELEYIGADNQKHRPVMIHRAPFGSMERFVAVLIEHTGGDFAFWLAPVQLIILPISDKFLPYCNSLKAEVEVAGFRVELDERTEKIGKKIRDAEVGKYPFMAIVGEKEVENGTVSLRKRKIGDQGVLEKGAFIAFLGQELENSLA